MRRSLFQRIFPGNRQEESAHGLYETIVRQAREPGFYADCGVPDSVDGRFELLVLHCWLVMRRLRGEGEEAAALSQTLFDTLIYDLDQSLRVSGVGDLKVGPKLKAMGQAFYGRARAYDEGLAEAEPAKLESALRRNLYGTLSEPPPAGPPAVAGYLRREAQALQAQATEALLRGELRFGPPPPAGEADAAAILDPKAPFA